jgi:hypothetical protein
MSRTKIAPLPAYLDEAIEDYRRSQGCGCCGCSYEVKAERRKTLDAMIRKYARRALSRLERASKPRGK